MFGSAIALVVVRTAIRLVSTDELLGRVVTTTDGDAVMLYDEAKEQRRIRLERIDAPEMKHRWRRGRFGG